MRKCLCEPPGEVREGKYKNGPWMFGPGPKIFYM